MVRDVKLAGRLIIPEGELRPLISVKAGDVFSRQQVTDSSKRISDRLGNDGYAFANVNAVPDIDRDKGTVGFTFFVDPGQRVYVRRVNFTGNLATNDVVLRREMRQYEGAWFSTEKVQRSRTRLLRLGIFEDVNIETPPVPGSPDQVDINVTVKERMVNTFMAGVGYSDAEGALFNASVNMKNFLGTGNELTLSGNNSKVNRHLNLSFIEPYFTADGISRTVSLSSTRTDAAQADIAAYILDGQSAALGFGLPVTETHSVNFGVGYEVVHVGLGTAPAKVAQDYVAAHGDTNSALKLTLGWAWDTLDNPLFPNSGFQHRFSAEVSTPGSDMEHYRWSYTASLYWPLTKNLTYKVKGSVDYGDSYGDTQELPFFKNYYAGGSSSVRGYASCWDRRTWADGPDVADRRQQTGAGKYRAAVPLPGGGRQQVHALECLHRCRYGVCTQCTDGARPVALFRRHRLQLVLADRPAVDQPCRAPEQGGG
jgi:outer membrane protein insertion porin family